MPCFNELYNLFYVEGKKIVPLNIAELLTPLGLCYWICDDGCLKNKGVALNTQSFSLEEVELLMSVLVNKFNFKCTIYKDRENWVIRISLGSPIFFVLPRGSTKKLRFALAKRSHGFDSSNGGIKT